MAPIAHIGLMECCMPTGIPRTATEKVREVCARKVDGDRPKETGLTSAVWSGTLRKTSDGLDRQHHAKSESAYDRVVGDSCCGDGFQFWRGSLLRSVRPRSE